MHSLIADTAFWAGEDFPEDSFTGHDQSHQEHDKGFPSPSASENPGRSQSVPPSPSVYLEKNYHIAVYFDDTVETDEYAPAFQFGIDCHRRLGDANATFESAEPELCQNWDIARGTSILAGTPAGLLDWERARHAVRGGWNHAYHCK